MVTDLRLRLCKRCGGDLFQDYDVENDFTFKFCLQCGQEHDLKGELPQVSDCPDPVTYHGGGHRGGKTKFKP